MPTPSADLVQITLFRHGETDWNAARRMQGGTDIPLNDVGRAQARQLAEQLVGLSLDLIVSSDLLRARETAEIVADRLKLPLVFDSRLREMGLGEAEGLLLDDVKRRFGDDAWPRWRSLLGDDLDYTFPGGESKRAAQQRALEALLDVIRGSSQRRVGVSTHGGIINSLIHHIRPPTAETPPIKMPNCAVFRLEHDRKAERWRTLDDGFP